MKIVNDMIGREITVLVDGRVITGTLHLLADPVAAVGSWWVDLSRVAAWAPGCHFLDGDTS